MRIALFDINAQLLELARAAALAKEHRVTLFCEPGEHGGKLLELFPSAMLEPDWEALLVAGQFDVLVVGHSPREISQRDELLRRCVQEGVPLVAVQPASESIVMHELAMIQQDTRSLLLPWNDARQHPAAQRVIELTKGASASHIVLERSMPAASRAAVFSQLACDADLLQALAGPLDRVTALGPAVQEKITSLAVTFAGQSEALIQWMLQPTSGRYAGRLTVGAGGRNYVLEMRPPGEPWVLRMAPPLAEAIQDEQFNLGDTMLQSIERAMAEDPSATATTAAWKDACHAAELAEGAQQSLRRGRTIQLHFEEHSEQQTFKGVMAIGGCLVLLLTLAVLGMTAVVDALGLPFRNSAWWRLWPLYVLAPAVLLLLAQSLWRVFSVPRAPAPRPTRPSDPSD